MVEWLSLSCPYCKVNLRIKAAYAHMRGRCPECGCRIEALAPQPVASHPSKTSDTPLGLVAIDEEWPEPAKLADERTSYELSTEPAPLSPPKPVAAAAAPAEVYELADEGLPALAPHVPDSPAPTSGLTLADLPSTPTVEAPALPKRRGKLLDRPAPYIPAHPFWEGIYLFPWHRDNLGVWLFLAIDFGMIAVLITIMGMIHEVQETLAGALMPLVIPAVMIAVLWTGTYASGCFLALVEETASGNHEISWPEGANIIEGLGKFIYLLWLSACCGIPGLALWVLGPPDKLWMDYVWWAFPLASWVACFPVLLFSSLAANAKWVLLDWRVFWGLLRKPQAALLMYVPFVVLLAGCTALGVWIFVQPSFLQAAWIGLAWSAALLIYGRALGRAGWMLTHDARKKKRRNRRLPRAETSDSGWGPDDELPEV
jgi:hypothetical protein